MVKRQILDDGGIVFSTAKGSECPKCSKPIKKCICKKLKNSKRPTGDGVVRIKRETKGRKGAGVTLLTDICLSTNELKILAKDLKKKCGTGGSLKDSVIELQGDVREQVKTLLEKKGFKVKICGG